MLKVSVFSSQGDLSGMQISPGGKYPRGQISYGANIIGNFTGANIIGVNFTGGKSLGGKFTRGQLSRGHLSGRQKYGRQIFGGGGGDLSRGGGVS